MEQAQFWVVNKKLNWTKMWMGALNSLLVFGEIISDLKQECQAEVENHNIQDCGSEVIMDYILLFKIFLAIILKYFDVVL